MYCHDSEFSDRQVLANNVDPDQTADQDLHSLLFQLHLPWMRYCVYYSTILGCPNFGGFTVDGSLKKQSGYPQGSAFWATSSEFGTYRLCEQPRFRRACASVQSCQNLRCSLIQAVSQEEPSDRKLPGPSEWLGMHN